MRLKAKYRIYTATAACMLFCILWAAQQTAYGNRMEKDIYESCAGIDEAKQTIETLQEERQKLLNWLNKLKKMATRLQAQPAGPARDYRLRAVMAEARELSDKLSELDGRIRGYREQVGNLTSRLQYIFEETKKSEQSRAGRKAKQCLEKARGIVPRGKQSSLKLAKVEIDPRDGPSEIRRKADLLDDSADKLEERLRSLEQSINRMERQVALRRAVDRAEGSDQLWGTDSRRRVSVRIDRAPGVKGVIETGDDHSRNIESGLTPDPHDGSEGHYDYGAADPVTQPADGETGSPAHSVSIQRVWNTTIRAIQDLAGKEVASNMEKDFASGNEQSRLKALRKARKLLRERSRAIRKQSKEFRKKASDIEKRVKTRKR